MMLQQLHLNYHEKRVRYSVFKKFFPAALATLEKFFFPRNNDKLIAELFSFVGYAVQASTFNALKCLISFDEID